MGWVDQQNNHKIDNLLSAGFSEIHSFTLLCYCFKFGKMTPFDRTSILMKTQRYCAEGFDPEEFIKYLDTRRIPFILRYIPAFEQSFSYNIEHLIRILKIKFKRLFL